MSISEVSDRINDLLSGLACDLTPEDNDGDPAPLAHPVITEWVLIANVHDLDSGEHRTALHCAPHMLYSHVLGLVALCTQRISGD